MGNFSIGINGIIGSHNAMETIANNIANVATEGYHRQRVNLKPADPSYNGAVMIGQGIDVLEAERLYDRFLENSILLQTSAGQQYDKELSIMQTVEAIFSDMSGVGLNESITQFYNSLKELSSDPQNNIVQNSVVNQANAMINQFHTIGTFISNIDNQVYQEAQNLIEEVNALSESVAQLNYRLHEMNVTDVEAGNLRDSRDQKITEIAELIGITTQQVDGCMTNVFVGGVPIVMGSISTDLEISPVTSSSIGIAPVEIKNYQTELRGGKIGGLMSINNEQLEPLKNRLDTLAYNIINEINKLHVQGVPSYNKDTGLGGSFTSLDGTYTLDENLSAMIPPVTDGTVYIRITDTATGTIQRHAVEITSATDTLTTVAAKFDALDGMSASVKNKAFHIESNAGYKFDFIPAPLPKSEAIVSESNLTGTSTATGTGIYTGTGNQDYTMTIVGTGTVGADSFNVDVRDGSGTLVDTINVPAAYVPGTTLSTVNGLEFNFSSGTVNSGETFTISALTSPEISGVYTGSTDENYTCTVVGTGTVGVTDNLSLQITNSTGDLVNTINIGSSYSPGTTFLVDSSQAIKLSLRAGDLTDGQKFDVKALANSDTSGFLVAAGVNTFFKGYHATSISVRDRISDNPASIGVSMGVSLADNENIKRISQLPDDQMLGLEGMTTDQYYRRMTTDLAQRIKIVSMNSENSEFVMMGLKTQRDKISGVDINNEAAELMVYQQMFQSMAKYLNAIKQSMDQVMAIL